MQKELQQFNKILKETKRLNGISALLEWDQENQMPPKAAEARAEQSALISKFTHEKLTDRKFEELVTDIFENREQLNPVEKRSIEFFKKNYDKLIKLPTEFVEEFSKAKSLAQSSWVQAKTKNDYSIFKPHLGKIINLTKKYANYVDSKYPAYDVLLDDYEEGMTTTKLTEIFSSLKNELVKLLTKIPEKSNKGSLSSIEFNKDITRKLLIELTSKIGFDYERGAIGEVHHPFETTISENDIRINVAYPKKNLDFSITSAIHEAGHGLYEQNIDPKYFDTALNQGVSLGIHESQSRLLENMIGRSNSFWEYFLPILKKYYPKLKKLKVEDIVNDLNIVKPSLIRTEADEVTYNLHIILRFEIELMLLNDELSIEDLPEVWNKKMKELLGVVPDSYSKGVLQDVHWSIGAIGYFPTYSLGNLVAGQLWHKFKVIHPDWEKEFSSGDFSSYFKWFKNNIWQHGSFYQPQALLKMTTGEDLNPKYFVDYLSSKYL